MDSGTLSHSVFINIYINKINMPGLEDLLSLASWVNLPSVTSLLNLPLTALFVIINSLLVYFIITEGRRKEHIHLDYKLLFFSFIIVIMLSSSISAILIHLNNSLADFFEALFSISSLLLFILLVLAYALDLEYLGRVVSLERLKGIINTIKDDIMDNRSFLACIIIIFLVIVFLYLIGLLYKIILGVGLKVLAMLVGLGVLCCSAFIRIFLRQNWKYVLLISTLTFFLIGIYFIFSYINTKTILQNRALFLTYSCSCFLEGNDTIYHVKITNHYDKKLFIIDERLFGKTIPYALITCNNSTCDISTLNDCSSSPTKHSNENMVLYPEETKCIKITMYNSTKKIGLIRIYTTEGILDIVPDKDCKNETISYAENYIK